MAPITSSSSGCSPPARCGDARRALVGLGHDGHRPVHPVPAGGLGDLGRGARPRPGFRATSSSPASWWSTCRRVSPGSWSPASSPPRWAPTAPPSTRWPRRPPTTSTPRGPGAATRCICSGSAGSSPAIWGGTLILGALFFHFGVSGRDTPVVVLALSIASVTYGALLGTYMLAGALAARDRAATWWARCWSRWWSCWSVVFAGRLAQAGLTWLAPVGRLAWPWYVPLGTAARRRDRGDPELSS